MRAKEAGTTDGPGAPDDPSTADGSSAPIGADDLPTVDGPTADGSSAPIGADDLPTVDGPTADLSEVPGDADSFERLLGHVVHAPAAALALAPDTIVADRYVVQRVLGAGGMGTVYLARDRSLDRIVALKVHRTAQLTDRLHREAVAMAKLAHPNVVTVFEIGEHDARPFVAMEYIAGCTLREYVRDKAPAPSAVLAAVVAAGHGLAAAHVAGLVHRDVKPDNIFVGDDGRVRIGDFGLAQLRGAPASTPSSAIAIALAARATLTGAVVGTPAYLAPEQIDGIEPDARTDQFALCVTAWEALCGARPFDGATSVALRAAIVRGPPAAPRRRLSPAVRRVLARGLAADPQRRWPSLPALIAALRRAINRPRRAAAGAAGAVAIGGIATYLLWPAPDVAARCALAADELGDIVPAAVVDAAVAAAGRGGRKNAVREAAMIRDFVAAFRANERALVGTECTLSAKGQWTEPMTTASNQCLDLRNRTLRELLAVAPETATQPSDVIAILQRAPTITTCASPRSVAAWRWLDPGKVASDAMLHARAQLDAAATLVELGEIAYGKQLAADPAIAHLATTSTDLDRRLMYLDATLAFAAGRFATAEDAFSKVYYGARSAEDSDVVLASVTHLVDLAWRVRHDDAATDRWVREGLIEAQRDQLDMPARAIDLVLEAASAVEDRGDHAHALALCDLADKGLPTPADRRHLEILGIRADALAATGKIDEALAAATKVVEGIRAIAGPDHPSVAEALARVAAILAGAGRNDDAIAAAHDGAAVLAANPDDRTLSIAIGAFALGQVLLGLRDNAGAEVLLQRARAIWVVAEGERHPDVALVDVNLALIALDRGEVAPAVAMLENATAIQAETLGPDHLELAAGLYNLAVAQRTAGRLAAALATAQRTVAILSAHEPAGDRHAAALLLAAEIQNLLGHHDDALATVARLRALRSLEPADEAWADLETGRALRDGKRARVELARAQAIFESLDMPARATEAAQAIAHRVD